MEKYLGVKIVHAEPAWKDLEHVFRKTKFDEESSKKFNWQDGYKVVYEDGYESWSPKEVFENAYKQIKEEYYGAVIHVSLQTGNWNFAKRIIPEQDIIETKTEDVVYRELKTENLTFGQAIEALKAGKSIARAGWNGKGMSLYLNKGCFDGPLLGFKPGDRIYPKHMSTIDGVRLGLFEYGNKGTVTRLPNIRMISAPGSIIEGWLASQTDMLAEDWVIVE